ncbi:hypothetical protein BH23CHL7_BH23CHL7_13100 [soil metagenome]
MTKEKAKPKSAQPPPELPESRVDLEPEVQPLAYDEPPEAHTAAPMGSAERALGPDSHPIGEQTPDGHIDEHAAGEHGHEERRLGPIDWAGWAYTLVGVSIALVVVAAFWIAAY